MKQEQYETIVGIGCIACRIEGCLDCGPTEVHHQNAGGHAGQKRLGDDFTVPLGRWHHRGVSPPGMDATRAREVHGPSLARESKAFRERYGSDDELRAKANALIATRFMGAA